MEVQGKLADFKNYQGEAEIKMDMLTSAKCIILPDNKYKQQWDVTLSISLLYVGVIVPLRVAFYEKMSTSMIIFESMIDVLFATDIVLTFLTGYEKNKQIEVKHKAIAQRYLRGWFILDLLATIPFQLVELAW